MRLQVTSGSFKHEQYVTGCGWTGSELYTCSDDKTVHKLTPEGDDAGKVVELKSCPTDLHWYPSGKLPHSSSSDQEHVEPQSLCGYGERVLVPTWGHLLLKMLYFIRSGRVLASRRDTRLRRGAGAGVKRQQSDIFAMACSDGTFVLVKRSGAVEKTVEAHKGAVISIR